MSIVNSPPRRSVRRAFVLCLLFAGCSPESAAPPIGAPQPPSPPPATPSVSFRLPADGATLVSTFRVSVSGSDVTRVSFELDGTQVLDDDAAPFEWNLDPRAYTKGTHEIRVAADVSSGTEWKSVSLVFADYPAGSPQPPEVFQAIANLAPGTWYEVPNTRLDAVAPSPIPSGSIDGVFTAWGSGAYDTRRDWLYTWGGGHGTYAGNEVYAFDARELRWLRLTDPSVYPDSGVLHADGAPMTRHPYDTIAYLPTLDAMFLPGGGGGYWELRNYGAPADDLNRSYLFNGGTAGWSNYGSTGVGAIMSVTGVDAEGDLWLVQANTSQGALWRFAPAAQTWTRFSYHQLWTSATGEIDPVRRVFVYIGAGAARKFDLAKLSPNPADSGKDFSEPVSLSGSGPIASARAPGLAYHPSSGKLVAWSGGRNVYSLDTLAWTWTEHRGAGADPGAPAQNGTFQRWVWCPPHGVFLVANSAFRNVFVYRPDF